MLITCIKKHVVTFVLGEQKFLLHWAIIHSIFQVLLQKEVNGSSFLPTVDRAINTKRRKREMSWGEIRVMQWKTYVTRLLIWVPVGLTVAFSHELNQMQLPSSSKTWKEQGRIPCILTISVSRKPNKILDL